MEKYKKGIFVLLLFASAIIALYYYAHSINYNWFFLAWLHVAAIFSAIHLFQNKTIKTALFCPAASTLFFILAGVCFTLRSIDIASPYDGKAIFLELFWGSMLLLALAVGMVLWAKRKYCNP